MHLTNKLTSVLAALSIAAFPVGAISTTAIASLTASPESAEAQSFSYSRIFIRNSTAETIQVAIKYKDYYRGWVTEYYTISPYSRSYIVDTKNRYIYVQARSLESQMTWRLRELDTGRYYEDYIHNFTY